MLSTFNYHFESVIDSMSGERGPARSTVLPLAAFLLIAFGFTWSYNALYESLLDARLSGTTPGRIVPYFGAWGPLIAVAVVLRMSDVSVADWFGRQVRSRNPSEAYLLALVLPNAVQAVPTVMYLWAGVPVEFSFPLVNFVLVFVFTLLLLGALEEFGWRGFLQPYLQERWGALPAALAVGVLWGAWHLPLLLAGDLGGMNPTLFLVHLLPMSVVMAWLYNSSSGVVPVMVFHAAHNAPGRFSTPTGAVPPGVSEVTYPTYTVAWILVGVAFVAYYGPSLAATSDGSEDLAPGPFRAD